MKFRYLNYKKLTFVLTGSIIISCSGCSNNINSDNFTPTPIVTLPTSTPATINTPAPTATPIPTSTPAPTATPVPTSTPTPNQEIIDIFKNIEKETIEIIENDKDSLEYAKALFVTLIDFIFFEKEFEDMKFEDLTEDEKRQILEITSFIDDKLENKFPNYRENISESGKEIYNKASEIIKNGAENIKNFSKEKLGEDFFKSLVEAKNDIKYFSINAWGYIKTFSVETYKEGKQYIKEWYNSIKEK